MSGGTSTAAPVRSAAPETGQPWRSTHGRTVLAYTTWLAGPLASVLAATVLKGGRVAPGTWIALGAAAVGCVVATAFGLARWATTRYRTTDSAFELRSGVFTRRRRSIPLGRIRSVDVTANPAHRLLGLAVLRVAAAGHAGSGGSDEGGVRLEALPRAEAVRLRAQLLGGNGAVGGGRAGSPGSSGQAGGAAGAAAEYAPLLAGHDLRRLRYAPLTFWVVGGVLAAAGSAWRALDGMGVNPLHTAAAHWIARQLGAGTPWLTVPAAVAVLLAAGCAGAVALGLENWWGLRVEWTDEGALSVRRGLLTTRSVTVAAGRLHGAVLHEPLLQRAAGAASVRAVAGGLGNRDENRKRSPLLPAADRTEAERVRDGVLRGGPHTGADAGPPGVARLTGHPRIALRRRVVRGLVCAVAPVAAALALLGALLHLPVLLHCAWAYVLVAVPAVWLLARDAYRSLGHALHGRHLLLRSGTFSRDLVALRRESVLSWSFSSTPLSRRAGTVSVTAAVAGGEDGYRLPDMAARDAVPFAHTAAPGILGDFLDHGRGEG